MSDIFDHALDAYEDLWNREGCYSRGDRRPSSSRSSPHKEERIFRPNSYYYNKNYIFERQIAESSMGLLLVYKDPLGDSVSKIWVPKSLCRKYTALDNGRISISIHKYTFSQLERLPMTIEIINIHTKKPYGLYIGRPRAGAEKNKWANPYPIKPEIGETRDVVIARHKQYLWKQLRSGEITVEEILALEGQTLGCFCNYPSQNCHGSNFIQLHEWLNAMGFKTQEDFLSWNARRGI